MRRCYKFLANVDILAQPVPARLYLMMYCVLNTAVSYGRPYRATITIILQITTILAVCIFAGACSLKPAPMAVDPLQWRKIDSLEKEEFLINKLDSINFGLAQFKGKGKLYVYKKGKLNLAERLFWICAAPDQMRLSVVASSGMPLASFASDGKWFYIRSHTDDYFSKKPLATANLDAIISVPVSATDIIFILSGRVAVLPHTTATFYQSNTEQDYMAVVNNDRKKKVARVYFDPEAVRVLRIERLDSRGHVQYEVTFSGHRSIDGYQVPYDIVVQNGAQDRARLKILSYWPHPAINDSVFSLHKTVQ